MSGANTFKNVNRDFIMYLCSDRDFTDVLTSEAFNMARVQKHHFKTTVADHSLAVAEASYNIALHFGKLGIKADMHQLIVAALCHDLGILGRFDGAFVSGYDCCMHHGIRSIAATRSILGNRLTEKEINCMETHMFPARPLPPSSVEGWILSLADKYCAVSDGIAGKRYPDIAVSGYRY